MSVKIRLTRQGKKRFAYYHIVIADGRAPRAGRFVEKIGTYNPNTDPATIDIDFDKAMYWLDKGAQATETVRAILSYKGVLMKRHLLGGVKKGVFSAEEAERRFAEWMKQKEGKIDAKRDRISREKEESLRKHLESESKVKEIRSQEILKKKSKLAEEADEVKGAEQLADVPQTPKTAKAPETAEKTEPTPVTEDNQEQVTEKKESVPEPPEVIHEEQGQEIAEETEGQEVASNSEGNEPEEKTEESKEEKSE